MKHPEKLNPEETAFESGKKSSYLRYNFLVKFLEGQEEGFRNQIEGDSSKGRDQLASLGQEAADKINDVVEIVDRMWTISEPYMKDKDKI